MRVFISINISDKIKKEIIKIQNKLPPSKSKLTEKENLHLTSKFLDEINEKEIEEVKSELREIKFLKFVTRITKI